MSWHPCDTQARLCDCQYVTVSVLWSVIQHHPVATLRKIWGSVSPGISMETQLPTNSDLPAGGNMGGPHGLPMPPGMMLLGPMMGPGPRPIQMGPRPPPPGPRPPPPGHAPALHSPDCSVRHLCPCRPELPLKPFTELLILYACQAPFGVGSGFGRGLSDSLGGFCKAFKE